MPAISVVVSTYNDQEFVEKKLKEIESQTAFREAEFIFIEPNSPGLERDWIAPFCQKHENCRMITLDHRVGLYRAWNIGWNSARAPYVCITNMDDSMHPRLLECVLEETERNDWDLLSVLIAKRSACDGNISWKPSCMRELELGKRPGAFFAWKRSLKDDLGMFDESLVLVGDKDFWARADQRGLKLGLLPKVLYLYTIHPSQLSKRGEFKAFKKNDRNFCDAKDYPHKWPDFYRKKVRWIRWLYRVPLIGRRYFVK